MDLYTLSSIRQSLEMTSDVVFDISSNLSIIFVDDS